jgi:ribosomal protein S18 acetylase RimI-like enzyme
MTLKHSQDEFYNNLVHEHLAGKRLYTRVVVAGDDVEAGQPSVNEMAACVVGPFTSSSRMTRRTQALLLPDKKRFKRLFYIMTLGTVTEHRQGGLATALLEWVEHLVQRDTSCGGVYLHVITNNATAIRFYERLGYSRVEELPDYYEIHGKKYPSYLYAKYFHGNRGHRDVVRMVARAFLTVWRQITHILPGSEPRSLEEDKF